MTTVSMQDHCSNVIMDDNNDIVGDSAPSNCMAVRAGNIVISATVSVDMTEGTVTYGIRYTVNGIVLQYHRR